MTTEDIKLLRFVHDRLEHVNGDRHGVDFLIALRELTDREEKALEGSDEIRGTDINTDIEKAKAVGDDGANLGHGFFKD